MRTTFAVILMSAVSAMASPTSRTAFARSPAEPEPIVAEGASFSEPANWKRLKTDRQKTKGWFVSPDPDMKNPAAMIMVDIGNPTKETLRSTAEAMARNWGGRVLDETTSLDGVEALRVRVDMPGPGLRPVEGILAMKDGKLYLLMGGAVPGRKVVDEVEEVRKNWRWVK